MTLIFQSFRLMRFGGSSRARPGGHGYRSLQAGRVDALRQSETVADDCGYLEIAALQNEPTDVTGTLTNGEARGG